MKCWSTPWLQTDTYPNPLTRHPPSWNRPTPLSTTLTYLQVYPTPDPPYRHTHPHQQADPIPLRPLSRHPPRLIPSLDHLHNTSTLISRLTSPSDPFQDIHPEWLLPWTTYITHPPSSVGWPLPLTPFHPVPHPHQQTDPVHLTL